MNIVVIDTETTGTDHEKDRVVEIGAVRVTTKGKRPKIVGTFETKVNPLMPMPPYARAIHHISDEELTDAPLWPDALELLRDFCGVDKFIPAAHSAAFDSAFFPKRSPWICTWRCARHIWPDLESHSNQALRYAIPEINMAIEKKGVEKAMPPHRALPDAWVTAHVVIRMLEEGKTPEELLALTTAPILLKTMRFGKHRGEKIENMPPDYLSWLCRQQDMDSDVKYTADHWLRRR